MEFALVTAGVKSVFPESPEDFADVFPVSAGVVGVDEDVVQIDDNTNVQEISEDLIDEALKRCRRIGKSERHYRPFVGSIAGPKGRFPLISGSNPDKVIGVPEIDFAVDSSLAGAVEEVGDEGERVTILASNLV